MANEYTKKNYMDYYSANDDFTGSRTIHSNEELVEYKSSSFARIWYNEQTESYAAHWHMAMEVIMPVENYYDITIKGTTYRINPGEIILIPPGELHALDAPDSGIRFVFLFDIEPITKVRGFSTFSSIFMQPIVLNKANYPYIYEDVYQLFVQMRNEYFSRNELSDLSIFSLLIQTFIKFGYNRINTINKTNGKMIVKQKEYVKKFSDLLDYIDENYAEELNLDIIAAQMNFSKFHFSRLFKQYTGYTFCDYLTHRRIKVSQSLLCNPELSITDIALQSGFSSISTFNRIFKQETNCTPSQYREINGTYD